MVEVQVTEHIRSAFGLILEKRKGVTEEELSQIRTHNSDSTKTIPYSLLFTTSKLLQSLQDANELPDKFPVFAHELIRGSKVIVPSIAAKVDTPEAIEKRKKLEAYVSNIRYKKMVHNIYHSTEQQQLQDKAEMADFRSQLGMGLNVIFSIAVALILGWYIGKRILHSDLGGLLVGLVLMILALVVETSLFTIHLSQVDMKKEKVDKKNLARENQERINGGLNLTPHLLQLSKNHKTQSYSLEGKELVSMPPMPLATTQPSTKVEEIIVDEAASEMDKQATSKATKRNKKANKS